MLCRRNRYDQRHRNLLITFTLDYIILDIFLFLKSSGRFRRQYSVSGPAVECPIALQRQCPIHFEVGHKISDIERRFTSHATFVFFYFLYNRPFNKLRHKNYRKFNFIETKLKGLESQYFGMAA